MFKNGGHRAAPLLGCSSVMGLTGVSVTMDPQDVRHRTPLGGHTQSVNLFSFNLQPMHLRWVLGFALGN